MDLPAPSLIRPGYRPIGDYAAIGDCRSVALVASDGAVEWLCWPHFASPPVFGALLDRRRGGHFRVTVPESTRTERRYVDGTNVLETTFHAADGAVRVVDALVLGDDGEGLMPQRELVRSVECLAGAPSLVLEYVPRPDFGRGGIELASRGGSLVAGHGRGEVLLLRSSITMHVVEGRNAAVAALRMRAGDRHEVSLAYTFRGIAVVPTLGADARSRLRRTTRWWRGWSGRCPGDVPYRGHVVRSGLVLKMLSNSLSGAIVAAPSTSLPEEIGGVRNYDYRYCWLRDASLTLRAFMELGYASEAAAFLDWLLHTTRLTRPHLQPVYDVFGGPNLAERHLQDVEGYRGSKPVRIGNDAFNQRQLDVYGAVCRAADAYVRAGGNLDRVTRRLLVGFGRVAAKHWREPEHGMWETPEKRQNTYSKLMCWLALDSLLELDRRIGMPLPRARFEAERDMIRAWIETRCWNPQVGAFVGTADSALPDANLYSLARTGFIDARDPRMASTHAYLERELGRGPLMKRYPPGSDVLPGGEGAFGIAGFWAVEYLARAGRVDEAARRFEQLVSYGNDVGLLAEEIDAGTGEQLGNFPQAFTHIGLITAALALGRASS